MRNFLGIVRAMWELMGDRPESELPTILEMRKEIVELEEQVKALKRVNHALICDRFGTYQADNLDINTLQLQFGAFFINSAFEDRYHADEVFFFKRTFMQALSCAYLAGQETHERSAK